MKGRLNLAVDVAMGPLFIVCAFTGIGAKGEAGGPAAVMHDATGYLLVALMVIHLALHWKWIAKKTRGMLHIEERRNVLAE
jgi:hypothetical protein